MLTRPMRRYSGLLLNIAEYVVFNFFPKYGLTIFFSSIHRDLINIVIKGAYRKTKSIYILCCTFLERFQGLAGSALYGREERRVMRANCNKNMGSRFDAVS